MKGQIGTVIVLIAIIGIAWFLLQTVTETVPYQDVWTVGDSITSPGVYQVGLDQLLGSNSSQHVIGVPGYSCSQVRELYRNNITSGGKTVIVFCGINDIALGQSPTQMQATYQSIKDLATQRGDRLVLVNIVPDSASGGQAYCPQTLQMNAWLPTIGVPVVDFYHKYYSGVDCYTNTSLTTDGLHPNYAGNQVLASAIFQQGFDGKKFGSTTTTTLWDKLTR